MSTKSRPLLLTLESLRAPRSVPYDWLLPPPFRRRSTITRLTFGARARFVTRLTIAMPGGWTELKPTKTARPRSTVPTQSGLALLLRYMGVGFRRGRIDGYCP